MADTTSLLAQEYLRLGIIGLSRGSNAFDGHNGAALIAAYYFSRRPEMQAEAQPLLKTQVDKIVRKHPDVFAPIPLTKSDSSLVARLPEALSKSIHRYTGIGHNVVYTTLAMKALGDVPEMATPEIISALCKMLGWFAANPAEEVMGIRLEELMAGEDVTTPAYDSPEAIATFALSELVDFDKIYPTNGFWGFQGHMLTHAHGLIELTRLGYPEVARRGYDAHRLHAKSLRRWHHYQGTDMKAAAPLAASPFTAAYWARRLDSAEPLEWHSFKYPYHTFELLDYVKDPSLKRNALDRLSCLINL